MALATEDYVAPAGDLILAALWPRNDGETDVDRDDRALEDIEAYRVQAYTKTTNDELTRKWVNYRAWSRYADVLNAIPASASNDDGSRAYLPQQIEYWRAKALEALAEFETAVEAEGAAYLTIQSYR